MVTTTVQNSLEASLFLRIAAARAANVDWAAIADHRPIDWDRMTAFALLENAETLLHERVHHLPESLLHAKQRDRIRRLALISTFKLKLLERRFQESLLVLTHAGIDVVLLKGSALAVTTYRSFTERPMADIDLLVNSERATEAHQLMQQNGWSVASTGHPSDAWDAHHHLRPLCDTNGSGLRLEIHVAPLPPGHPFELSSASVASTSRRVVLNGAAVSVLESHTHAVYTAIHFAWSHHFESGAVNAFRDMASLQANGEFSWIRFVEIARQTRAEACCYWTLRLAESLVGLSVPKQVLSQLAPALRGPVLSLLEEHLSQLVLRSERACPSVALRRLLWGLALQTDTSEIPVPARRAELDANPRRRASRLRRLGPHVLRLRKWKLYLTELLVALLAAA